MAFFNLFGPNLQLPKLLRGLNVSSKYDSSLPEEYDDTTREVDIVLYAHPIGSSVSSGSRGSGFVSAAQKTFAHWILVFEFCDQTVRAIEGVNENDFLLPSFSKCRDESWTRVKFIATRQMSPKDVRSLAVNNALNGCPYSLLNANCHKWINLVLEDLGLDEIPSTIDNEIKWKTTALYATMAHPLAGAAVLAVQQLYNASKGDPTPVLPLL
ncbi:hypothetical protein O3M35_008721 [Rhynocoris fuscipes]|uniref:LRAT domain-containing protein n=1 Tax=Rhynocoris fuscipes TaxID=488301 RepID=A0AAW1DCX0_9HEMI